MLLINMFNKINYIQYFTCQHIQQFPTNWENFFFYIYRVNYP